jgi:glyoxylase-like metal-dependent hydrolase (beta-lactamase superfamily II)
MLLLAPAQAAWARAPLVLYTDFGMADGAVAAVKGVAYSVSRDILISDLSHEDPGSIFAGAYRLYQAESFWPRDTVFVAVIDPGDDPVTIHLNGEHVRLLPIRAAHTDGDTLVSFPEHDILAVGDYFRSVGYPVVDLSNGGSLAGILEGLRATIDRAGPDTKIIPGHGPVTDRKALIAQRDLILALRDKVASLVAQNKTLEEVVAAKLTADIDPQIPQGEETSERFIKWLYAEVKTTKAGVKTGQATQ